MRYTIATRTSRNPWRLYASVIGADVALDLLRALSDLGELASAVREVDGVWLATMSPRAE